MPLRVAASTPSAVDVVLRSTAPSGLRAQMLMSVDRPIHIQPELITPVQTGEFDEEDVDKVSVTRAVGLSLLLPGTGHWTMGSKNRAGVFFGTEAIAWTAFGYFKMTQQAKDDDLSLYARTHAGADTRNKDEDYFRALTFYASREQYNEEGRLLDANRPYYPDEARWDWDWDSEESMARYRAIRNQSSEAASRARFTIGAIVVNRLVAAVDAWRTARAINREARMETAQWKVRLKGKASLSNPGAMVIVSKRF